MKRVLVIGDSSYIGHAFCEYGAERLLIRGVSSRVLLPDAALFAGIDSVLFCAGVAHRKETAENRAEYFAVNRDLAVRTAMAARAAGVCQFIYLSSASVYGMTTGVISEATQPHPRDAYGRSKWEAEQQLTRLETDTFGVALIRPPMVYGPGCKGNFPRLVGLVARLPAFPKVKNHRSMLYIDTLSEFLTVCVERQLRGIYHPQDAQYMNTTDLAAAIAEALEKPLLLSGFLSAFVPLLCLHPAGKKVFGTLIYEQHLSGRELVPAQISVLEAVRISVRQTRRGEEAK